MLDIITIGSATKDIFLDAAKSKKGQGFCFPLGQKIEMENMKSFTGGGGVNAATTFTLQGLKTGFCGVVGQDMAGQDIIEELQSLNIETGLVKIKSGKATDVGIILHEKNERSILLYHSSSKTFGEKDIDWQSLKQTQWLYIAPLWQEAAKLTAKLIDFAKENQIKIALNPSQNQLSLSLIKKVIKDINVLILNSDEASILTGVKTYQEKVVFQKIEKQVFREIRKMTKAIIVVTKGKNGAAAMDNKFIYQVPAVPIKVTDATGAGDSFGSGFVAGLIRRKTIEQSLQLAMANAISNIQVFGANKGLVGKNDKIQDIKITKQALS
ncbi:MAG: carbohydrate kinase family protein [bacterium]|nr:carbohydrate kinase family protein [bacterium]